MNTRSNNTSISGFFSDIGSIVNTVAEEIIPRKSPTKVAAPVVATSATSATSATATATSATSATATATSATATATSATATAANFEDVACRVCSCKDDEANMLLCDGCDDGFHTSCINLSEIPLGDWFCPLCVKKGVTKKTTVEQEYTEKPEKDMRIYLYQRVSSKGQNAPEFGRVGLETQNNVLLTYCVNNGLSVERTFKDVGSGRDLANLENLQKMVKRIPFGTCILVYSVSRFARNFSDAYTLLKDLHDRDCFVYSVSEEVSSLEQKFANLLHAVEAESQRLSTLMRASIARRRKEGARIGRAPKGFTNVRVNGILTLQRVVVPK